MGYILTFIFGCICGAAALMLFACLAVASDDDDILENGPPVFANQDVCVCCGEVVPEGRMVCSNCEGKD